MRAYEPFETIRLSLIQFRVDEHSGKDSKSLHKITNVDDQDQLLYLKCKLSKLKNKSSVHFPLFLTSARFIHQGKSNTTLSKITMDMTGNCT